MPDRSSRPRVAPYVASGSAAAYESALARAHRGMWQARAEAAARGWLGEEYDLTLLMHEVAELGQEALARRRRPGPAVPLDGLEL